MGSRICRRTIAVLTDRLEDEYQTQVFAGIEAAARELDAHCVCVCGGVLDSPYPPGRERNFCFDILRTGVFDGLILMSGSLSNHVGVTGLGAYCRRFAPAPMCSIGVRLEGVPNVLIDNASGLERSIGALFERGKRRRVAFIRGPVLNEEAEIRYAAYQRVLARQGITFDPDLVVCGDFHEASGAEAVRLLLDERGQVFDALVAASDYMALGALEALIARGIEVPSSVAVSGFDDAPDARFAPVPLSTVRQPLHDQGRHALRLLWAYIDSGESPGDVILPTEVVVRRSCGLDPPHASGTASATAEYEQARRRLRQAHQIRALRRSGQALSSAVSEHEALSAVRGALHGIGIPRAVVCLYDPPSASPAAVRRIRIEGAPETEPAWIPPEDLVSNVRDVLDSAPWPEDERVSTVIEPLFGAAGPLGMGIFQIGPAEGMVYEFLCEQLSAALCTASLVKRLVTETGRREAAEKERTAREIELANRIQTGILPRQPSVQGLELTAGMHTALQVGGDYYDVLPFPGGCWLGIGDVAGHGLSTGLVMLMIQSVVAGSCASTPHALPSEIVAVLNQVIYENVRQRLQRDEHATLALLRYTLDGNLVVAGGHEDVVVCRSETGTCELIRTPGPWIGAFRDVGESNVDAHHRLRPGDILVLYTDGLTEATDANGNVFGLERLCSELEQVRTESAAAIHEHLMRKVSSWQLSQTDDVTLVVARYIGP